MSNDCHRMHFKKKEHFPVMMDLIKKKQKRSKCRHQIVIKSANVNINIILLDGQIDISVGLEYNIRSLFSLT